MSIIQHRRKRKMNDPRNTLFREFVRSTKIIKPKIIIGENVKGILTKKTNDNELYLDIIIKEFEKLDYKVIYKIFKCEKYNIPQKRQRFIMLGIHKNNINDFKLEFPEENKNKTNLTNIIKFNMKGSLKISDNIIKNLKIPDECVLINLENNESENKPHPYLIRKRDHEKRI